MSNENNSLVCNKQNMFLYVDKEEKIYTLSFQLKDLQKIDQDELLSFKIYNLMEKLNPDFIDSIEILNEISNDEVIVLFIFKHIAKEIGLKQKYMIIKTTKNRISNESVQFYSHNIPCNDLDKDLILPFKLDKMEPIQCVFANLDIVKYDIDVIDILYKFKIITNDNLPNHMENMIGLLMKKLFFNIKVFIEKIS